MALFIAAAVAATAFVFVQGAHDARHDARRDAGSSARIAAGQLGSALTVVRSTVAQLATTPQIEQLLTVPEACTLTFVGPPGAEAGHVDVLRADGTVACSSQPRGPAATRSYRRASWFRRAAAGVVVAAPVTDPALGAHAVVAAAPIKGGVIAGFLALEPAGAGLKRLYGGGRPAEFLITAADGATVLTRSIDGARWVGRRLTPAQVPRAAIDAPQADLDGTKRIYATARVPGVGWRFYVGEDEHAALAAAHRLRDRQLAIIVIGLAICLLVSFGVYRRVAVPVRRLGAAVRASSGQATPVPVPVSGPAEVTNLGDDVNGLISAVGRELSERQQAQDAARASERNYRLLFDGSPVPTLVYELDTRMIVQVNDAAVGQYGWSRDELTARSMDDIESGDGRHRRHDGSLIEVDVVGHEVTFGGRPARVVMAEDVGARARLERQLRQAQRLESVGRLASGVAHDFNNLLTAVIGYGDLLLSRIAPGEPHRVEVEQIKQAGERAVALTRQLLMFGRDQELEPVVVDVNHTVTGLEPMLRRLIRADIVIETRLAPEATRIRGDRGQLEQVLVNLVVNAGHAMPDGGRVTIATTTTDLDQEFFDLNPVGQAPPGRYVVIEVVDTGVGMDDETMAHIFEPFFTTRGDDHGTGLGLATVYGIVRQFGGFIVPYSELGRGTAFKLHVPATHDEVVVRDETEPVMLPAATGATVLLVDDDPVLRILVRRMLEVHGFEIFDAEDGDEARSVSDARSPDSLDVLVTDTVIPGPGGVKLADLLRQRHPSLRTLIMSGYSEKDAIGETPLDRWTDFIGKPFTRADLDVKLAALLRDADSDAASDLPER